jgi:hypothetical protein
MSFILFGVLDIRNDVLVCEGEWSSYEIRDIVGDYGVQCLVGQLYVITYTLVCIYRSTYESFLHGLLSNRIGCRVYDVRMLCIFVRWKKTTSCSSLQIETCRGEYE